MSIKEDLIKAGYTQFDQKVFGHENASTFFQKRIRSEKATSYFIDIYEYDYIRHGETTLPIAYQLDVQFTKGDGVVNVSFTIDSVTEAEKYCDELFTKMDFDNYEDE